MNEIWYRHGNKSVQKNQNSVVFLIQVVVDIVTSESAYISCIKNYEIT